MLITPRLVMRRFTPDDWPDLYEYLSDPEVVFFEPYDVFSEDECKKEAVRRFGDESFWAVCLRESGKLIGNVYLSERDFACWELGFVFGTSYQGQGYAFEASSALIDYVVAKRGAHRIAAACNPENVKSWRLLERLGMRREGHLRNNIYFKTDADGKPVWQDTYEYAILSSERNAGTHNI